MNVVITGATDGIGLALAQHYQQQGARLVLIGRRPVETLDSTFFTPDRYCQADLATPNSIKQILFWLHENKIDGLELVIHNAAVGYVGAVETQGEESIRQLVNVNLRAPIALTHALYPLVERVAGKFVFVSSVVAGLPGPDYAVYTATKAALDSFVRNWQIELRADRSPVQAQVIRPGATRTQMHAKSGADLQRLGWERFPTSAAVAQQLVRAATSRRRATTLGVRNGLLYTAGHRLPALMDRLVALRQHPSTPAPQHLVSRNTDAPLHCVITGAADGIGRALAQQFTSSGATVTGIDVDVDRATQTQADLINAGGRIRFLVADLTALPKMNNILERLTTRPAIDIFIHNAGISAVGPFVASDIERQCKVIDLNLTAPLLLTAGLLQRGLLTPHSSLAFVSSLSHFVSYPGATVYAATKDGLASYARSLAVALAPQGKHVLTIYPGPTRTAHARRYSPDNRREARRMAPEVLAQQIAKALHQRQRRLIPGFTHRATALAGQLWPRLTEEIMRRTLYEQLR
ncbi:MAG: SDR family NAD(P)-dependent oxidoreductase [Caldilinea sp. CFX5]|nr:SDR family NAD(P)-dependent oxidoreductase [Caldilinea sp. CFX5]